MKNRITDVEPSSVAPAGSNAVLAEGLYYALTHIRAAVRFHQVLQVKCSNRKTLLLDTFILMNNTGLWSTGFSLMDMYPKIDRLIELGIVVKRKNNERDLYDSYFLAHAGWLQPFR